MNSRTLFKYLFKVSIDHYKVINFFNYNKIKFFNIFQIIYLITFFFWIIVFLNYQTFYFNIFIKLCYYIYYIHYEVCDATITIITFSDFWLHTEVVNLYSKLLSGDFLEILWESLNRMRMHFKRVECHVFTIS